MRNHTEEEIEDARIEAIEKRLNQAGRCLRCGRRLYGGGGENPDLRYCECEEAPNHDPVP